MNFVNPTIRETKISDISKLVLVLVLGLFWGMKPTSSYANDMVVNAEKSLEWNQKEAFYHATGNAEALQGKQEIRAESLKAFYDSSQLSEQ